MILLARHYKGREAGRYTVKRIKKIRALKH
jgi:hypothetical protein